MANCNLCPLATQSQVPGFGSKNPKLIVIGDHPTADDERTGQPFSAGKVEGKDYPNLIIPRVMAALGVQREDIYWAYALRCNNRRGKDVIKIKPAFLATCRSQHLDLELQEVNCPVILATGSDALRGLLPELKGGTGENRGQWHEIVIGGRQRLVRATFAGSFIHNNSMFTAVELPNGKIVPDARWNPPGSCAWLFQKDMRAVESKLKELGLLESA